MTGLPMPKPWRDRQASEAALLGVGADGKVPDDHGEDAPSAKPAIAAVASMVRQLGQRDASCDLHGPFVSTGSSLRGGREIWTRCGRCLEEEHEALKREAEADLARRRRAALEERLKRTALPERFVGKGFDCWNAETEPQVKALRVVREFAEGFGAHRLRGSWLVLAGGVGTGKSHLAGAVLQALPHNQVGLYTTVMELVRSVRETWRKNADASEAEVIAEFARVDLLVVDEVGVQYGTAAEQLLLFEILDRRYLERRPTILLTNLDRQAFAGFVGERLIDRMREVARWVQFDWPSYRARAREEVTP